MVERATYIVMKCVRRLPLDSFHESRDPVTYLRFAKNCFVDRALCHSNDEHHILLSWLMRLKSPEKACFFDVVKIRETQMITIH